MNKKLILSFLVAFLALLLLSLVSAYYVVNTPKTNNPYCQSSYAQQYPSLSVQFNGYFYPANYNSKTYQLVGSEDCMHGNCASNLQYKTTYFNPPTNPQIAVPINQGWNIKVR